MLALTPSLRPRRSLLLGIALLGPLPAGLWAQAPADARLLETSHWAYEYLSRLRGRGLLGALDPFAQPYRRADVARAVNALATDTLPEPLAGWVRLLRTEFASDLAPAGGLAGALVWGGVSAATTQRLDGLRALDTGGAWPRLGVGGWVQSGAFAAETRALGDTYLRHDPDGRLPYLLLGGLTDHTYALLSWRTGSVMLGRVARNWGAIGSRGLLLSDNPISYAQLGVDLRVGRFAVQGFTGQLDTAGGTRRYLAANRVAYVRPTFSLAVTEALLYSAANGGLSLQLLNPFTLLAFESENPPDEDRAGNLMLGLDLWYGGGAWEVYASGLLDDVDVDPDTQFSRRAPTRYAATLQAKWHPVRGALEADVTYRRVSSYAYRSYSASESYHHFGRGLGENFADYDGVSLSVHLFPPISGLRFTPTGSLLRQGEGDWRVPFPDEATFRSSPSMFLGVVERTYRLALQGRYQPRREVWLRWDVGQNVIRNAGHVLDRRLSRFAALVDVGLRVGFGPWRW